MGDNDAETMSNVTAANFEFHSPEFDDVSDDAKDMITNLLQPDKTWVLFSYAVELRQVVHSSLHCGCRVAVVRESEFDVTNTELMLHIA